MIYVWILCFLQLLTLTASQRVMVKELSDKIELSCEADAKVKSKGDETGKSKMTLNYKDENSGQYQCVNSKGVTSEIFVKFRTCENCIKMDMISIIGMVIGDVVATIIIGVGVYIVASTTRTTSVPPNRKRSDGYPPPSHKPRVDPNDPYQRLRPKGPKELYGDLKTRR